MATKWYYTHVTFMQTNVFEKRWHIDMQFCDKTFIDTTVITSLTTCFCCANKVKNFTNLASITDSISIFSNYKARNLIVAILLTFWVGKLMSKCSITTAKEKIVGQRILQKKQWLCYLQKVKQFHSQIHATNSLRNTCTSHEISSYQLFYKWWK